MPKLRAKVGLPAPSHLAMSVIRRFESRPLLRILCLRRALTAQDFAAEYRSAFLFFEVSTGQHTVNHMSNVISQLSDQLPREELPAEVRQAAERLQRLVETAAYVGEVVSLGYNDAVLQIHDYHRKQVGGIPALCFLIGTRVTTGELPDPREEDASVVLLRVIDQADLPNSEEARRVRVETAQRVSGELGINWDDRAVMDATTHNLLSYAGVRCRVIGTFYTLNCAEGAQPKWELQWAACNC